MATLTLKNVNLVTIKKGTEKESQRIAINLEGGDVVFVSPNILCHAMGIAYTKSNGQEVTAEMIAQQKSQKKEETKKGA